jgi:hypothetical protein
MALDARDNPITRDQAYEWLHDYGPDRSDEAALRAFLEDKIASLGLDDTDINTQAHDTLDDITPVVDMILMDLDSYGD